jgi:hypothetical protein
LWNGRFDRVAGRVIIEKGRRVPLDESPAAIRRALEDAGVEVIAAKNGKGVGVRRREGQPSPSLIPLQLRFPQCVPLRSVNTRFFVAVDRLPFRSRKGVRRSS